MPHATMVSTLRICTQAIRRIPCKFFGVEPFFVKNLRLQLQALIADRVRERRVRSPSSSATIATYLAVTSGACGHDDHPLLHLRKSAQEID